MKDYNWERKNIKKVDKILEINDCIEKNLSENSTPEERESAMKLIEHNILKIKDLCELTYSLIVISDKHNILKDE